MSPFTVSLPDELLPQLRARADDLPKILELGLRELNADGQAGFEGASEVLELLASLPSPEEILKLRPSPRLEARVAKSQSGEMTPVDEADWERYEYLEHLVRTAKASAQLKLSLTAGNG